MNEVEAVKTPEQRTQLEAQLLDAGQIYFDIWKCGVNLALRISDLLTITMADVKALDTNAPALHLVEKKTGKKRKIVVNGAALNIMRRRLDDHPRHKFLFQSEAVNINRRTQQPINRRSVCRVFEKAGKKIAPKVSIGTHSMRKTRGYAMYDAGRSIESICKVLNHSTPAVTMRYIGIDQRDIDQSYVEFEL
jgi:integrase